MATEDSDQDIKSKRVTLADLSAKGAALYAEKKYEDAADIFSKASTLQASINGETAPENAEILFHYGRSLFKVGQSKSDVLGAPATTAVASKTGADESEAVKGVADAKKPLFQFTGDENFDQHEEDEDEDEDEEGRGEDEDAEAAEDQGEDAPDDELAMAFEILDLARVCYLKQLQHHEKEEEESSSDKDKNAQDPPPPALRHMKERLADTHDCLAEISLENERYQDAIEDGRVSLKYKQELYPEDSEIIAEAHYKLSLALEFASVNPASDSKEEEKEGGGGGEEKKPTVDEKLRNEAIEQLNLAIKSIRLKLQNNEVELATMASPEDNDAARKAIADMKDVVADMEQKLADLKENPLGAKALLDSLAHSIIKQKEASFKQGQNDAPALDVNDLVRKKRKACSEDDDEPGKQQQQVADAPSSPSKKLKTHQSSTSSNDADKQKAQDTTAEATDASSNKDKADAAV
ncbi:hypothetical protein L249_4800 [Ophiocordyceps polyrhachis-furcata BCC 54312]|uniref:Tetratricopeptide SHNi-TPR domain-containing protein n=1 Tax=Ophiocordyceps polyrhachis-furcata BCC 54312 TaxID=1330021 RepID=A0A367L2X0_9HYPO|nr:hypothetical protein L249_4800 [Ophiocordyceps polyrhachis-furcata BCC 54312]